MIKWLRERLWLHDWMYHEGKCKRICLVCGKREGSVADKDTTYPVWEVKERGEEGKHYE